VTRAFWFALALVGAVLVQTALGYLVAGPGRFVDPFLLLVVYAALVGGETRGMLAGAAAGWVQDVVFGGRILGLSALSKLVVGYAVGMAGGRFLIATPGARALVVLAASVADGILVPWLASIFQLEVTPVGVLAFVGRACANALVGGLLFAAVERRLQRSLS
jgi:rod shape-determining protein MreD